jgi:hypothetical protein
MMKKPLQSVYYFLVKLCNTNLVSLFAGMTFGIVINIVTGPPVTGKGALAIIFLLLAVIMFITLNTIRQNIDSRFMNFQGNGMNDRERWLSAIDPNDMGRCVLFFFALLLSVSALATGISLIYSTNYDQAIYVRERKAATDKIESLKEDSVRTHKLVDSLLRIHPKPVPCRPPV